MDNPTSNQLIIKEDFPTLELVMRKLNSLNYGELTKTDSGNWTHTNGKLPTENIYFISETQNAKYQYTIEKFEGHYTLSVFETYKHGMITGAVIGDLGMFIKYFVNTEKMKEFSLSTASQHGNWNIIEYLISNYELNGDPVWYAIRWNHVKILNNLLDRKSSLPKDWLTYSIYCNSLEVAQELLLKKRLNYKPADEKWFAKEILKDNATANFVKSVLNLS